MQLIQSGLCYYPNCIPDFAASAIVDILKTQFLNQGYPVKKGLVYAHYGMMWAVNDKGNDSFPVFGKHLLKKDTSSGFGKNLPAIDTDKLTPVNIKCGSSNSWYHYYQNDQLGRPLAAIPEYLLTVIQHITGIDTSVYDSAIINAYGLESYLSRHIDNTEDLSASLIPIVSLNFLSSCIMNHSSPVINPNNHLKDDRELIIDKNSLYWFGGHSRYMPHRVQVGNNLTDTIRHTQGSLDISRINITLRRASPISQIELNEWYENSVSIHKLL